MSLLERIEPYDLLAAGIPGTLLITWVAICYPTVAVSWSVEGMPEAFAVVVLAATAIFAGQIVVGLASFLESALYVTWGGRPSDMALRGMRPQIIDPAKAQELVSLLKKKFGSTLSLGSLFIRALRLADAKSASLTPRFNALYAYQRSLVCFLTLALAVFATSARWGAVSEWPRAMSWTVLLGLLGGLILSWHRAKQRANYLVREALAIAEQVLGAPASDPGEEEYANV